MGKLSAVKVFFHLVTLVTLLRVLKLTVVLKAVLRSLWNSKSFSLKWLCQTCLGETDHIEDKRDILVPHKNNGDGQNGGL